MKKIFSALLCGLMLIQGINTPILATEKEVLETMEDVDNELEKASYGAMQRLYNPNSGEHFYTGDVNERNHLVSVGWKDEGTAWHAPETSTTPVYRLYSSALEDHHYTTDSNEKDALTKLGWKYEGISWYSDDQKGTPLHRLYNKNAKKAGSHHYTTNKGEADTLVSQGWKYEGIAWYGLASNSSTTDPSYSFQQLAGTYGFEMSHGGNALKIDSNGNFVGDYRYMVRGDSGADYPNGTRRYSKYRGKMEIKGNQLIITQISLDEVPGSYYIENGIRYLAMDTEKELEITTNSTFVIYPPGTPYSDIDPKATSHLKSGFHNGPTTPTYSLVLITSLYPRGYRGAKN